MRAVPVIALLTLIFVAVQPPPATAADNAGLIAQRALFRIMFKKAASGTLKFSDPGLKALRNYPLYPYLIAQDLRHQLKANPGKALDNKVAHFIDSHPDLPPARRLRDPWLESLGKRGRWQQIIAHTHANDTTSDQCRVVHARIELGQAPKQKALALWRVGRSQPKTCDPVFAWLDEQDLLTPQEILRRAKLAYLAGQYGMVRYLSKNLPSKQAAQAADWLAVIHDPAKLRSAAKLPDDILAYAFKRYALRHWSAAAAMYPQLVKRLKPGRDAQYEMQRYIALLYAQAHKPEALIWFARLDHSRMDAHTHAWEVRAAIWQRRWPLVIEAIKAMPADLASEEEWRFWLGRALLATDQTEQAGRILGELASHRAYYGYLAADLLGLDYSFNEHPLPENSQARGKILARPALTRARELYALGRSWRWRFRLEWNQVIHGLDQAGLRAAARIASQRGWHSRAIITLARGNYWDDLDIRYPTPHIDVIKQYAADSALDPAYVLAIIRTESLFQPAVVSPAGAIGLMQLMPGTAKRVARHSGLAAPSRSALNQPTTNIRLGTKYLQKMKTRFAGNIALATAAYNAGPNAVDRWLPNKDDVPPEIWIANISYTETRKYVQDVMAHMTVFQHRLHEKVVPLNKRLAPVHANSAQSSG